MAINRYGPRCDARGLPCAGRAGSRARRRQPAARRRRRRAGRVRRGLRAARMLAARDGAARPAGAQRR